MIGPAVWVVAALAFLTVLVWPTRSARDQVASLVVLPAGSASPQRAGDRRRPAARVLRRRGAGTRHADAEHLVSLLEAVEPALAAGLSPARAWDAALRTGAYDGDGPAGSLARAVRDAVGNGQAIAPAITAVAGRVRSRHLLMLGIAWHISDHTGAPVAGVTRTVAAMVRADLVAARRLEAVATESRTTARILTALPLCGPFCVAALGLDVGALGDAGPWLWFALVAGIGLAVAGRRWLSRLAADVLRSPVLPHRPRVRLRRWRG